MKVETIKEFGGMSIGIVKTIPDVYAKELLERGLVKSLDEKPIKKTKEVKTEETKTEE